jgi:hypothetical protein
MAIGLGVVMIAGCVKCRRWPSTDRFVELLAYGAGIQSGGQLFREAFTAHADDRAWILLIGGSAAMLVSARGAWRMLKKAWQATPRLPQPKPAPLDEEPPPPG